MGEIGFTILIGYCVMAFVKLMFATPSLPTAVLTASRLVGKEEGKIDWGYAIMFLIAIICSSFFCWIPLLYRERHKFFCVYDSQEVIDDVVRGYHSSNH